MQKLLLISQSYYWIILCTFFTSISNLHPFYFPFTCILFIFLLWIVTVPLSYNLFAILLKQFHSKNPFYQFETTSLVSRASDKVYWNVIFRFRGSIQEKIGSKNGPFTKISDLKTDPSQKSASLKQILHKNQRP